MFTMSGVMTGQQESWVPAAITLAQASGFHAAPNEAPGADEFVELGGPSPRALLVSKKDGVAEFVVHLMAKTPLTDATYAVDGRQQLLSN